MGLLDQHRHEPPRVRQIRSHALDGHRAMEPVRAPNDIQEHLGMAAGDDADVILLPAAELPGAARPGDSIEVFVHLDSDKRMVGEISPAWPKS